MSQPLRALVVSTGKNVAWVSVDGETQARIAQVRRQTGKRSMPVPGDVVWVSILEDGKTVLERSEPRSNELVRRTVEGRAKTMAANVDLLVAVTALAQPSPRLTSLDQLLAYAQLAEIDAMVVLTKPDLTEDDAAERLARLYAELSYPTLIANPKRGDGMAALRQSLTGRHALLSGNSGVGKSSIFRSLGGDSHIGDVSRHGMGRQTTTSAKLYRFGDGFLIDSPGVNEFGLGTIDAAELVGGFREMAQPALRCRFTDCRHVREPGCGVRSAVDDGVVASSRYASYVRILEGQPETSR